MIRHATYAEQAETINEVFSGLKQEEIAASYDMGGRTRYVRERSGIRWDGSGGDWHYWSERDFMRMIEIGLDIDRNDVIVGAAVTRIVTNVIQQGFELQPDTGNETVNDILQQHWAEWAEDPQQCDAQGEHTFDELTCLAFRGVLVAGDILGYPRQDGKLEMVEAYRLRSGMAANNKPNPNQSIVHGVQLDADRRRINYWLANDSIRPNSIVDYRSLTPVPAYDTMGNRNMFHLRLPKRSTQTRGISALAPISNTITQHDDLNFATMIAAKTAACYVILREQHPSTPNPENRQAQDTQYLEQPDPNGRYNIYEKISPGMEVKGAPGESISGFNANIPNATYFDHCRMILTYISVNLDLPLIVLLMDASQTNFSGWRGAWDQAKIRFRYLQKWLAMHWCRQIYEWKLRQWLTIDDRLQRYATWRSVNIGKHRWEPPSWPYIEPMKDTAADILSGRNAHNSPRRIQAARGRRYNDVAVEIVEDNDFIIRAAMAAADAIRTDFPDHAIEWPQLISLPTPDRVTAHISLDGMQATEPEQQQTPQAPEPA